MLPVALLALLSLAVALPIDSPAAAPGLPWTPLSNSFMLPGLPQQEDQIRWRPSPATGQKTKALEARAVRTKLPPTATPPPGYRRTKQLPDATAAPPSSNTTTTRTTTTTTPASSATGAVAWNQKTNFFSLASFVQNLAVPRFTFGQSNVQVIQGVPQSAWAAGVPASNNASTLEIAYPAYSFSPGNTPQGGVGFYSQPLDLSTASNVSLAYSVFFPADFDWVKGGKLPGLYGGRSGCSGGQDAEDCFSTRMMWRTGGLGELYLYAPREKQVAAMCTLPPLSYCNTVDGMSIGRGSFQFLRGQWNNIRQDIWMNTPGVADGGFNIWFNDKLVLHSNSVYYRNPVGATKVGIGPGGSALPLIDYDNLPDGTVIPNGGFTNANQIPGYVPGPTTPNDAANKKSRRSVDLSSGQGAGLGKRQTVSKPIGFVGLMFHTFRGGSTISWSSPRLQYSYINQVAIRIRS